MLISRRGSKERFAPFPTRRISAIKILSACKKREQLSRSLTVFHCGNLNPLNFHKRCSKFHEGEGGGGKEKKRKRKKKKKKRREEKEKSRSQKITRNYVQDCTKLLSLRRHCKGIFISEKRCTCFLEARINELNKETSRSGEGGEGPKKNRELRCV